MIIFFISLQFNPICCFEVTLTLNNEKSCGQYYKWSHIIIDLHLKSRSGERVCQWCPYCMTTTVLLNGHWTNGYCNKKLNPTYFSLGLLLKTEEKKKKNLRFSLDLVISLLCVSFKQTLSPRHKPLYSKGLIPVTYSMRFQSLTSDRTSMV